MRNLKRALSLTLASVMLLGMMVVGSSAAGYPDVSEEDNIEAIEVLQAVKVMVGDENGNFGPEQPVNRSQMAVVMALLLDLDYDYYQGTCPFWDVPSWAEPYVAACYANGIVSGYNAYEYGAADPVTAVQAASMMMRALGYFKFASDYADGFELSTVKQASKILLFTGINANATDALTRNQVAQLALNTLKTPIVEAQDNTFNITSTTGDASITASGGQVNYVVTASNQAYARAIDATESNGIALNGVQGYIIELGEQLYNGDLKLDNYNEDDFGRPARRWEYKGREIGTYAKFELMSEEYTVAINGKTLYDLLGKSVIEDNYVEYFWNGRPDSTIAATNMIRSNTKNYSTTGNGVLTQVFFEPDRETITITSINTFLAKAEDDFDENKEELAVAIFSDADNKDNGSTKVAFNTDDKVSLEECAIVSKYEEGDKFLVQVAWNGSNGYDIVKVMDTSDVLPDVTLNKYSENNYVVTGSNQYDYAVGGKVTGALNDLGEYGTLQLVDYTYNLYFDQYGYLIGNEKVTDADRYVFISGYDFSGSHLGISYATASAIFTDGDMRNITVDVSKTQDKIDEYNHLANGGDPDDFDTYKNNPTTSNYNSLSLSPKWYYDFNDANGSEDRKSEYNMWFTYTTSTNADGQTIYTLTPVANWINQVYDNSEKINGYTLRTSAVVPNASDASSSVGLTGGVPGAKGVTQHWAVGDEASVFLTVDTKAVTSGTAKGISKVTGVYTGVQDISIDVKSAGTNGLTGVERYNAAKKTDATYVVGTNASVYAVAEDHYIVAAVVIGKDTGSTTSYGYILGNAKDEAYENDYHYWTFEGVLDGKIQELTIRLSDVDDFKTLKGHIQDWMSKPDTSSTDNIYDNSANNGFVEFEFDKDGYIIDATRIVKDGPKDGGNVGDNENGVYDESDYGNWTDPNDYSTYLMPWGNGKGAVRTDNPGVDGTADFVTYEAEWTLHAGDKNPTEAGLALIKNGSGTVVVVETEVYTGGEASKVVWTQFSDLKKAIEYLDKEGDRADAFTGWVAGPLSGGIAQWLVLNTNQVKVVDTTGGGSKNPGSDGPQDDNNVVNNGGGNFDVYYWVTDFPTDVKVKAEIIRLMEKVTGMKVKSYSYPVGNKMVFDDGTTFGATATITPKPQVKVLLDGVPIKVNGADVLVDAGVKVNAADVKAWVLPDGSYLVNQETKASAGGDDLTINGGDGTADTDIAASATNADVNIYTANTVTDNSSSTITYTDAATGATATYTSGDYARKGLVLTVTKADDGAYQQYVDYDGTAIGGQAAPGTAPIGTYVVKGTGTEEITLKTGAMLRVNGVDQGVIGSAESITFGGYPSGTAFAPLKKLNAAGSHWASTDSASVTESIDGFTYTYASGDVDDGVIDLIPVVEIGTLTKLTAAYAYIDSDGDAQTQSVTAGLFVKVGTKLALEQGTAADGDITTNGSGTLKDVVTGNNGEGTKAKATYEVVKTDLGTSGLTFTAP